VCSKVCQTVVCIGTRWKTNLTNLRQKEKEAACNKLSSVDITALTFVEYKYI
jgi:hypothetical protein